MEFNFRHLVGTLHEVDIGKGINGAVRLVEFVKTKVKGTQSNNRMESNAVS